MLLVVSGACADGYCLQHLNSKNAHKMYPSCNWGPLLLGLLALLLVLLDQLLLVALHGGGVSQVLHGELALALQWYLNRHQCTTGGLVSPGWRPAAWPRSQTCRSMALQQQPTCIPPWFPSQESTPCACSPPQSQGPRLNVEIMTTTTMMIMLKNNDV